MSTLEAFTAVAAATGAITGVLGIGLQAVQTRRDRYGVRVTNGLSWLEGEDSAMGQVRITAFSQRRPLTITGCGIRFEAGPSICPVMEDVELAEGKSHAFYLDLSKLRRNVSSNPLLGRPKFAYVEANGEEFRSKLGWLEKASITCASPSGLWWAISRWFSFLPTPGRKRKQVLAEALSERSAPEDNLSRANRY